MGGRGASAGGGLPSAVKTQLKKMAADGKMPSVIAGKAELQAKLFSEIDKLYPMPDTSKAKITDHGDGYHIRIGSQTIRTSFPSGYKASEKEKRGVLKWALHGR